MIQRLTLFSVLLTLLAACSGAPAAPVSAPTGAPTAPDAFPITIEHKYGSTAISQAPTRVVSVGFTDQDALLALGVVPVGIRDWYGDQPNAVWPWAQDELGDATPEILPANALNFEQIAALTPDLIVGISSGMTEQDYATLSAIAPTIAQSGAYIDYGVPWQEQTRVIGAALGRAAQAEALLAEVDGLFADVRAQNPAFAGASAVVAVNFNNAYSAYGPQDVRGRLLMSLGFTIPYAIAELAGNSFFTAISNERLDLIDTDVLVIAVSSAAERAVIEGDPLFQQLNAAQQGRVVFLDQELSGAASFSSVLSLPYLLERVVPALTAAIDGDPATLGAPAGAAAETTRTVTHALGSTTVPVNPQRIAVLDTFALEAVLALGLTPVGAVYNDQIAQQPFIQGRLDGVTNLGAIGEPNLERLLALNPDLILTVNVYDDVQQTYDQLTQIAPTVPVDFATSAAWKDVFTKFAAALGRDTEAEELLAAYDARTAAFRASVGDALADTTVSIVRAYADGSLRLYLRDSFAGVVLSDAGVNWPAAQPSSGFSEDISKERLDLAEADVVFLWTANDPEGEQAIADLQADPLWQQLAAVQNKRVYAAPRYWIGSGMLAAEAILDDLYAAFGENT